MNINLIDDDFDFNDHKPDDFTINLNSIKFEKQNLSRGVQEELNKKLKLQKDQQGILNKQPTKKPKQENSYKFEKVEKKEGCFVIPSYSGYGRHGRAEIVHGKIYL